MSAETTLTGSVESLLERQRAEVLADLERRHRRELEGNPEGMALLDDALREAMLAGVRAQANIERRYTSELEAGPDAWDAWQRVKDATPEALDWPDELAETAPGARDRAGELLASAGAELGFHGRGLDDLRRTGEMAAKATAALVRSIAEPADETSTAMLAQPAQLGPVAPDGTVRVAWAANQAEGELMQGLLESAGIASTWKRGGPDLPQLMSGGPRDIYVAQSAAAEAQTLLATRQETAVAPPESATQRVGLERTGIRLIGKATAAFIVFGGVTALYVFASAAVAVPVLGVLIAATVLWSERRSRSTE
jgi:hypothetical protein